MHTVDKELSDRIKPGMKVGLLGGTFNPAHEGHVYISAEALKRFDLDLVVWLVSPQNPMKTEDVRGSLASRTKYAKIFASKESGIIVTDIEKNFDSFNTLDTITTLKGIYPDVNFIWMMGADNMVQFPKWHRWQDIIDLVPVCVFDREEFMAEALSGEVVQNFPNGKIVEENYNGDLNDFSWYFVKITKQSISSTQIRSKV